MKVRKTLLAAAGWAGLAATAAGQAPVPAVPTPVPPPPLPIGVAPQVPPPAGTTIWSKLGISKEQKEACRRKLCRTQLGQLINNSKAPLTALSGGLIPPFCPLTPSAAELADPGAQGAAAAVMADEAGAKARRAAVRYLGTVDCHYWPEAEAALIASLRGDRNECVRWEAAMALGRGCCCTKQTIDALSIVVSCSDRDGAPKETSYRVHAAAAAALDHCLACYANVAAAPATPIETGPPIREGGPVREGPPPADGPATVPATPPTTPDTASTKVTVNPGEAKPAPGLTPTPPAPAPAVRPVGPAYYARVAKVPLAAILTEARRVSEKYHATPTVADTPFQSQGHTVAALMSYAVGPDKQAVIPAGMTVPAGEMRAEVVSAKPVSLVDWLSRPNDEGPATVVRSETVVVQPPPPPVKSRETVVTRTVTVPKETIKTVTVPKETIKPEPVAKKLQLAPPPSPEPMPTPMPMPKGEPLTLDFPPPAPMMPSPSTPTAGSQYSSPYMAATNPLQSRTPTMQPKTQPAAVASMSPYFATGGTPTGVAYQTQPVTSSAVSAYHPTPAKQPQPQPPSVVVLPPAPPAPLQSPSPYTVALPPAPPAKLGAPVPASLPPTVDHGPTVPMSTRPMPAPPAPVIPARADVNTEIVDHLLQTARGTGPVEVRKASIQALAKLKANSPQVLTALDGLADDPAPAVRAEAIIAAARLRMGR